MTREERLAFQGLAFVTALGGSVMIGFGVGLGGWELLVGGAMVVVAIGAVVWSAGR